jgi:AcrR family transcriptional regulator
MTDADRRREEIVDAAADLFEREGYSRASLGDLAALVGMAKPTLYHYFGRKDEILFAIHDDLITRLMDRQEQRLKSTHLREDQLLLEVMGDILEMIDTRSGYVRTFFEHHRELDAEMQPLILEKWDRYQKMVEEVIDSGIKSGVFRQTDAHLASLAMFGMCNWAYKWYEPGGPLRSREVVYYLWDLLINGLGAEGGPPPSGNGRSEASADGN